MYSKNFSFCPGFGMPGRVFLSKIPSWENNLSLRKPEQFARVGGAKIYGVNASLCLPIFTPIGTMVVAMYSTQNLARDMTWEKKCMEYFWKLKPEPKWKLTIDVGLKTTADDDARDVPPSGAPGSPPRVEPAASEGAFLIPPSPTSSKISKERPKPQPRAASTASNSPITGNGPCASPTTAPYVWNRSARWRRGSDVAAVSMGVAGGVENNSFGECQKRKRISTPEKCCRGDGTKAGELFVGVVGGTTGG